VGIVYETPFINIPFLKYFISEDVGTSVIDYYFSNGENKSDYIMVWS
jgi:hypothetical protein